jgi:hypothetical protein
MTAREKANELYMMFYGELYHLTVSRPRVAKRCALNAVDEIIKRDKQWVAQLSKENPEQWQLSDINKSVAMFEEVREEVMKM